MPTDNTQKPTGIDRLTTAVTDQLTSRRTFMATSAIAGAGALGISMPAGADEHGDNDSDNGDENSMEMMDEEDERDDIGILNFARTLEFLEARFYQEGLDTIGEQGLRCSDPLQAVGGDVRDRAYDDLRVIQEHEVIRTGSLGSRFETTRVTLRFLCGRR